MTFVTIIGVVGAFFILIAFIGNELGRLKTTSLWYDGLNVLGSGLLMYYSVLLASWPFIILNIVWLVFSLKDIVRRIV